MNPEPLTYKHSFNSGDLITVLPGMKHLYEQTGRKAKIFQRLNFPVYYGLSNPTHPVQKDGKHVCMNEEIFAMMKPLLESQEYIESFEVWNGEKVNFNLDDTRLDTREPIPGGLIQKWPSLIFPQLECDLSKPWINVKVTSIGNRILINRTERYLNEYIDYHFLKNYPSNYFGFVGTENEHNIFCNQFGLEINRVVATDFYYLAIAINSCRFFIGNQSLCYHLAESIKVPRVLEVCSAYPNTFPIGEDGYSFINQGALEYHFEYLLKKFA